MDTSTPAPKADEVIPTITPEITAAIDSKAEAIATQKIEKMKEDLAASLSGKQQPTAPKSWDEVYQTATDKATAAATAQVTQRLEAMEKDRQAKEQSTVKQAEDQNKAEWARMSEQWTEAVADGIIPDIGAEVKTKLKSGVQFSDLTPDEQNDPGLKAYNDARALHITLRNEGKSTNFYRTIDKFYNKQPAGSRAPVLGGATPTPGPDSELSYDEVKANRKARYGF